MGFILELFSDFPLLQDNAGNLKHHIHGPLWATFPHYLPLTPHN